MGFFKNTWSNIKNCISIKKPKEKSYYYDTFGLPMQLNSKRIMLKPQNRGFFEKSWSNVKKSVSIKRPKKISYFEEHCGVRKQLNQKKKMLKHQSIRFIKYTWSNIRKCVSIKRSYQVSYFEKTFGIVQDEIPEGKEDMYARGAGNYYHKVYFEEIAGDNADLFEQLREYKRKKKLEKLESFEEMKKHTKWMRQFDYAAFNVIK